MRFLSETLSDHIWSVMAASAGIGVYAVLSYVGMHYSFRCYCRCYVFFVVVIVVVYVVGICAVGVFVGVYTFMTPRSRGPYLGGRCPGCTSASLCRCPP